jgi:hypothetical protein
MTSVQMTARLTEKGPVKVQNILIGASQMTGPNQATVILGVLGLNPEISRNPSGQKAGAPKKWRGVLIVTKTMILLVRNAASNVLLRTSITNSSARNTTAGQNSNVNCVTAVFIGLMSAISNRQCGETSKSD